MRVLHEQAVDATPESAFYRLQAFLGRRRSSSEPVDEMEDFERELHAYFVGAEQEVLAEELARLDVDLPAVTIIRHLQTHRRDPGKRRVVSKANGTLMCQWQTYTQRLSCPQWH